MTDDFQTFKKIPRLSRECYITEKIDGTNAQIRITAEGEMIVGSRNKVITPKDDNHGFAKWCEEHKEELMKLGEGTHYGEWWGKGIQRGYGIKEKRFSLFNVSRWNDEQKRPSCCHVVPTLYQGIFTTTAVEEAIEELKKNGSKAVSVLPRYDKPEGVVIYHVAGNLFFKKTIHHDELRKGEKNDIL